MVVEDSWSRVLRGFRISRGLKQQSLALLLGVHQATISRWENGIEQPTVAMQKRIRDLVYRSDHGELIHANLLGSDIVIAELQDRNGRILHASAPSRQIHGGEGVDRFSYLDTTEENFQLYETTEAKAFFSLEVAQASVNLHTRTARGREIYVVTEATPFIDDSGRPLALVVWREIGQEEYLRRGGFQITNITLMDEIGP